MALLDTAGQKGAVWASVLGGGSVLGSLEVAAVLVLSLKPSQFHSPCTSDTFQSLPSGCLEFWNIHSLWHVTVRASDIVSNYAVHHHRQQYSRCQNAHEQAESAVREHVSGITCMPLQQSSTPAAALKPLLHAVLVDWVFDGAVSRWTGSATSAPSGPWAAVWSPGSPGLPMFCANGLPAHKHGVCSRTYTRCHARIQ